MKLMSLEEISDIEAKGTEDIKAKQIAKNIVRELRLTRESPTYQYIAEAIQEYQDEYINEQDRGLEHISARIDSLRSLNASANFPLIFSLISSILFILYSTANNRYPTHFETMLYTAFTTGSIATLTALSIASRTADEMRRLVNKVSFRYLIHDALFFWMMFLLFNLVNPLALSSNVFWAAIMVLAHHGLFRFCMAYQTKNILIKTIKHQRDIHRARAWKYKVVQFLIRDIGDDVELTKAALSELDEKQKTNQA